MKKYNLFHTEERGIIHIIVLAIGSFSVSLYFELIKHPPFSLGDFLVGGIAGTLIGIFLSALWRHIQLKIRG